MAARAERLALFRAFDAAETDALRVLVVQDFEGVSIEDGNDWTGEVVGTGWVLKTEKDT